MGVSLLRTAKSLLTGRTIHMRGSRRFCQKGSNFVEVFFLDDEESPDPNTIISGS